MATSVKEFFDKRVPDALARNADKVKDIAAVYLFKVSGPDGGTWTCDLLANPPTCIVGASGNPACTIEAADADFATMIDGGMQAAMQLFFSGKIKIIGDPVLATKLTKLLQMANT